METANIATPQKHFTLAEMSKVMMDRTKIPVGFFVSQALWDGLSARVHKEEGFGLGNGPSAWAEAANDHEIRSGFVRIVDGLPNHVDQLASLGNSVIPQIPEAIGRAIMKART